MIPAAIRSGKPARQNRSSHGMICGRYSGRTVNGPSGSLSQRGNLRHMSLVASGMMSEKAKAPGIAAARFLGNTLAVDQQHAPPASHKLVGAREADNAGPDDDDVCIHGLRPPSLRLRPAVDRLLDDRGDALALLALQRQARRAHPLAAFAGHLVGELDVLDELGRHIEMQQRHEPAIELDASACARPWRA